MIFCPYRGCEPVTCPCLPCCVSQSETIHCELNKGVPETQTPNNKVHFWSKWVKSE